MPRPGYVNLRLTEANRAQLRTICEFLRLDPDAHAAQVDAINYALRMTVDQIARSWLDRPPDASTGDAE